MKYRQEVGIFHFNSCNIGLSAKAEQRYGLTSPLRQHEYSFRLNFNARFRQFAPIDSSRRERWNDFDQAIISKRFSHIHIDLVGPLNPAFEGKNV